MKKAVLLVCLATSWAGLFAGEPPYLPVTPSAMGRDLAVATFKAMLLPGQEVRFSDTQGKADEDGFSVGGMTLSGTNGKVALTADRLAVRRLERGGRVLRTEWALENARYSPDYLDGMLETVGKAMKTSKAQADGVPEGEPTPGAQNSPDASSALPVFHLLKDEMAKPFQCQGTLTWDPGAKTLTLDPLRTQWGDGLGASMGARFDGAEGKTLDDVLPRVGPTGVASLVQNGGAMAVMMKPSPGRLGVSHQWGRLKAGHGGVDLLALARRLDVKQPMVLGLLGHPSFPAKPAVAAELGFDLVRDSGTLKVSPFTLEMKPGLRLSFAITCDHLDWDAVGKLTDGAKIGDLAVKDMVLRNLTVSLTDLGALPMAYQMAGDTMKKKPDDAKALALAKIDELAKPQKNNKGMPAAYVKAIRDFVSGKNPTLTLRLKEGVPLAELDKRKGEFDKTFVLE